MFAGDAATVTHRLRVTEAEMADWDERDRELIRLLTSQLKTLQSQGYPQQLVTNGVRASLRRAGLWKERSDPAGGTPK